MAMTAVYLWKCINCSMVIRTTCDFHINDRPICLRCNAEMEPAQPLASVTAYEENREESWLSCRLQKILVESC
jgi:hypothetical protein